MANGFEVDPDQVSAHANTVRGFADRASTATDAGSQLASMDEAYGILCQPFGMMLNSPQQRGTETLAKTEQATTRLAEDLNAAARQYQEMEDKVTDILRQLASAVEGAATPDKGA